MIAALAHNICSPLGWSSSENFSAVVAGRSALMLYTGKWGLPDAFTASLFPQGAIEAAFEQLLVAMGREGECRNYTRFEKLAILSIAYACRDARQRESGFEIESGQTLFVLSTTKGNIHLLDSKMRQEESGSLAIGESAEHIAAFFGNMNGAIAISNACTSGVSAQITASRLLESGKYRYAVVCGADIQSPFIVSGFNSFKALSPAECRPFDANRCGLNLGEAAATIILERCTGRAGEENLWCLEGGAIRNDANHISGPSRTAEGSYNALRAVMPADAGSLSFVSLHGTATLYNDQMEAIALQRAGLERIPAGSLKGWYGHTMGACGIMESILSMIAVEQGVILPTRGYRECGVSGEINILKSIAKSGRRSFIKLLSGFGGCNAAVRWSLKGASERAEMPIAADEPKAEFRPLHSIHISPQGVLLDGRSIECEGCGDNLIENLYRSGRMNYPKFHKMDSLCKLGFVASELLLQEYSREQKRPAAKGAEEFGESCAVAFAGRYGSLANDIKYQESIQPENYYPSPALFVYTLPNIVTGEIAIRNGIKGETNFFLLKEKDWSRIEMLMETLMVERSVSSIVGGWLDYLDGEHFEADIKFYKKQ